MRLMLSTAVLMGALMSTTPVHAMCGGGQQGANASVGMCGGMNMGQAPATGAEQSKPQQSGMCGCCKNMAMMREGQGGGHMQHMPGMEMPKQ